MNAKSNIIAPLLFSFLILSTKAAEKADARSPEAQAAYDKGMAAAERQDWDNGIKYFSQAQKFATQDGAILKNLGLAHLKAGHTLAAIAIFRAALAASEPPPQTDKLREEILKLEIAEDQKVKKFFKQATEAANLLDDDESKLFERSFGQFWKGSEKAYLLGEITEGKALSGDLEGALADLESIKKMSKNLGVSSAQDHLKYLYALSLCDGYDFDGALETAKEIDDLHESENKIKEKIANRKKLGFHRNTVEKWLAMVSEDRLVRGYWDENQQKPVDKVIYDYLDEDSEIKKIRDGSSSLDTKYKGMADAPHKIAVVATLAGQFLFKIRTHERIGASR